MAYGLAKYSSAVLPPTVDASTPPSVYLFDVNSMVNLGGRLRSEAEFRTLLTTAGFELATITPLPAYRNTYTLLEASPMRDKMTYEPENAPARRAAVVVPQGKPPSTLLVETSTSDQSRRVAREGYLIIDASYLVANIGYSFFFLTVSTILPAAVVSQPGMAERSEVRLLNDCTWLHLRDLREKCWGHGASIYPPADLTAVHGDEPPSGAR